MSAPASESWSPPADDRSASGPSSSGRRATVAAVAAIVVYLGAWALLHEGFYTRDQIVDTPVYERYGAAIAGGQVPYRDFGLEYPPGALPVFALPALGSGAEDDSTFTARFEALMWVCGAAALVAVALTLSALGAGDRRLAAALGFAALAPLALGSVVLSRFDLWPAALTACALAALCRGRERLGLGVLGLAVSAKVYPAVLVPLALTFVWRRRGPRESLLCAAVLVCVLVACFAPFLALAPGGVWDSVVRQTTRPLQLESLGSAFFLAAHQVAGVGLTMRSSHGSQNLAGTGPDVVGAVQTLLQLAALLWVWLSFARAPSVDRERLVLASAAAVCAFVALGKVLSPQYLIWLLPLVPLVRGRRGLTASALLGAACVLTQLWFPFSYWDLALRFDGTSSWLVLVRDLVLVGLLAVLIWPERKPKAAS